MEAAPISFDCVLGGCFFVHFCPVELYFFLGPLLKLFKVHRLGPLIRLLSPYRLFVPNVPRLEQNVNISLGEYFRSILDVLIQPKAHSQALQCMLQSLHVFFLSDSGLPAINRTPVRPRTTLFVLYFFRDLLLSFKQLLLIVGRRLGLRSTIVRLWEQQLFLLFFALLCLSLRFGVTCESGSRCCHCRG